MFRFLILSLFLVNFNLTAKVEKTLEIQCTSFVSMIDNINSRVSSDKQLIVESCDESFETTFFGIVKKNFKSTIVLSSPSTLCSDAKQIEKFPVDLGHGVALGVDYQRKIEALESFGLVRGDLVNYGGLIGVYLVNFHSPVCE